MWTNELNMGSHHMHLIHIGSMHAWGSHPPMAQHWHTIIYIYIFVYIYICVYTHVYIDMHAWSHGAPMDLQTKSHIWDPRAPIMSLCVDIRNIKSTRNYACVSI
jgi:hypothetical protein